MDETQVWSRAGRSRADRGLVGGRLCDGRLAKGRSCDDAKPRGKCARADTRANAHKGEHARADTMAVRGTADGEVGLKQSISFECQNLGSGW